MPHPMNTAPTGTAARRPATWIPLAPTVAVLLAIAFGLCGGYLDLGLILLRKYCWDEEGYLRTARDFPWTVPLGHALLLVGPGLLVGCINLPRRKLVTLRVAAWLFATLAIWAALLRLPLYAACSLLLAVGIGRLIGDAVVVRGLSPRPVAICRGGPADRARSPGGALVRLGRRPRTSRGGRIAGGADRRPERRADRLGYGALLQPRPLRLLPGYDAQPVAVGTERRQVRLRPGACPLDVSLRIPASSPASGLSGSILSGTSGWIRPIRPWRSTWRRGAIRPPGSRRIPTTAPTRPAWNAGSPISRIIR